MSHFEGPAYLLCALQASDVTQELAVIPRQVLNAWQLVLVVDAPPWLKKKKKARYDLNNKLFSVMLCVFFLFLFLWLFLCDL